MKASDKWEHYTVDKKPLPIMLSDELIYAMWRAIYHPFYKRRRRRMAGK